MTPVKLPGLFYDDVLVNMIVGYTELYGHREKANISFEITNEKIRLFLRMLLLRGCYKLPDREMYCETSPNTSSFEQQVCSTKRGYAYALPLATNSCKKRNVATLNSEHQAKMQCNFD